MRIVQFIKKLNNTELGKARTHDTYVLVPNIVNITDIFESNNAKIDFEDVKSKEIIQLRKTEGREKRIVGLGEYYRSKNLSAGDEIILEKRILDNNTSEYYINYNKYDDIVIFQKYSYGFQLLNDERWKLVEKWMKKYANSFCVEIKERRKKRNDSPDETVFYDISINNNSILNNYKFKEMIIIKENNNEIYVRKFCNWKKISFASDF